MNRLILVATACLSSTAGMAAAQTGVSNDRVSLPSGPGSLEGVGENALIDTNMGTMSYAVPIAVPQGFAGVTPELSLSYDSGAGSSIAGIGWQLGAPSIERMTIRKLPRYDLQDDFAADGGSELVRLPGSEPPEYRQRYEGSFVRYTWRDAGSGGEGYWVAEYPDGRVGYFGADSEGNLVAQARESGPSGTYRYYLVEVQDVYGHALRHRYVKDGAATLLSAIEYVFAGDEPSYEVRFAYEQRSDGTGEELVLDAKPGFELLLTQRLSEIAVYARGERIRRYALSYEEYGASGGFTRLTNVQLYGQQDGAYPGAFAFGYSRALGGVCASDECEKPFLVSMGSTGVDLSVGRATLVDLNGDALPDLVQTPESGNHQIFLSEPEEDGRGSRFAEAVTSAAGTSGYALGTGVTQVLDVDGDGLADLLNTRLGRYLKNDGSGDWAGEQALSSSAGLPDFAADFDPTEEDDQRSIKFIDYDNDKLIDVIRSSQAATNVYRNLGADGFAEDGSVEPIGAGFVEDGLDLSDMNGDGLLDAVRIMPSTVSYRIHYGHGRFGPWRSITDLPVTQTDIDQKLAELVDLNGDALSDLVVVSGSTVRYALSRNGARFSEQAEITSADVDGGAIPTRSETTTVLFADMNGNGSSDVVWVEASGETQYLELFPVRPNLLSRIENGLGQVTAVSYGTSVSHMARDGGDAWSHALPSPMIVVDRLDVWDELTQLHEVTAYRYHDGYYDGPEKQFRGYEWVETVLEGDETHESGLTSAVYDVGAEDRYRKGLLLTERVESDGRVLHESEHEYEDCEVAGVPEETLLPVRHVCRTASRTVLQEGLAQERWAQLESREQHDGYGNVVLSSELGVTSIGGEGCQPCERDEETFGAPCGDECLGDEQYTATEYVSPESTGGRWILHAPYRERSYGVRGGPVAETQTYYDGEPFEGLALGELTAGTVSRVRASVSEERSIDVSRSRHDEHGMAVETLDALGEPEAPGHRRLYSYDRENLRVVRTELPLEDEDGEYSLVQEVAYEPLFDRTSRSTGFELWEGGEAAETPRTTFYTYDEFGRSLTITRPGDDAGEPTFQYRYELGNPVSTVRVLGRSESGGEPDIETLQCLDGRGRMFQSRTRLSSGEYHVSGFAVFNPRGAAVQLYQPYAGDSVECDSAAPDGVLSTRYRYDAAHRAIEVTAPDGELYETPSVARTEYEPLLTRQFDENDSDGESAHADTPLLVHSDGLGRVVRYERLLEAEESETVELRFDTLGHLSAVVDPAGHEKVQHHDLLGRVLAVEDPNRTGPSMYEYDDAGNLIERTDARGVVTRSRYDGLNRLLSRLDADGDDATQSEWRYDRLPGCDQCSNASGELVEITYPLAGLSDQPGRERFGYDDRGRPSFSEKTLEGFAYRFEHSYDNADRLRSTTYPGGEVVEYEYDDASRLVSIPDILPELAYDERSQLARLTYDNGISLRQSYDERMRLAHAVTGPDERDQDVLQGFGYERDRVGNVTRVRDLATESELESLAASYGYDAHYRVVSAELEDESLEYGFDALDNVTHKRSSDEDSLEHLGDYGYYEEQPNALAEAGGQSFEYDEDGHVTELGARTLSWDFLGRMTEVRQGEQALGSFVFGNDQRRQAKIEAGSVSHYVTADYIVRDGIASLYVRAGGVRAARLDSAALATRLFKDVAPREEPDGKIRAADAWLSWAAAEDIVELDESEPSDPGRLLTSAARRLLLEEGEPRAYLHHDHLGSLTLATGEEGAVLGQRAFYPTGQERADKAGYVDEFGFTGQELDPSTGLVHFEFRDLDPVTGRFTSIDPAFAVATTGNVGLLGESTAAYAYVGGNWANAIDPTGLKRTLGSVFRAGFRKIFGRGGQKLRKPGIRDEFAFTPSRTTLKPRRPNESEAVSKVRTAAAKELVQKLIEQADAHRKAGYAKELDPQIASLFKTVFGRDLAEAQEIIQQSGLDDVLKGWGYEGAVSKPDAEAQQARKQRKFQHMNWKQGVRERQAAQRLPREDLAKLQATAL